MTNQTPPAQDILFGSAAAAAELVRRREVGSRELTELALERIETVNPTLNAVIELRREAALREAEAADRTSARQHAGALHGVPITIKDSFDVAGLHTTWGNPAFAGYIADADATVVRRLRQAGAIVVGKSNVAFMLADFGQTANELYGVTRNPWNPARTPGGSTGGGAASVASGMSFLDYGSDLVGSIRIPASFCGVYGLRPTPGVVPLTGFAPPGAPKTAGEASYMASAGPLARSAADLRIALAITGGPERPQALAYDWRLPASRHANLSEFRVGFVLDDPSVPVSSEVGSTLADAVDRLSAAGATMLHGWPEGVDPDAVHESFGAHIGLFFALADPTQGAPDLDGLAVHEQRRLATRATWARYFEQIDVFLCPTNFTAAFVHDDRPFTHRTILTPDGERRYDEQPFWTAHAALPGLPALSAPVGLTVGGLPVGMQIMGPRYEEETLLRFAELLADVAGGYQRPPD